MYIEINLCLSILAVPTAFSLTESILKDLVIIEKKRDRAVTCIQIKLTIFV